MTKRGVNIYTTHNSAHFYWRYMKNTPTIYLQLRRFDALKADKGWYLDAKACLEAAHLFARLVKELKEKEKHKKPKPSIASVKKPKVK